MSKTPEERRKAVIYSQKWAAANPERVKRNWRKAHLKKHGLTPESFDAIWESQDSRCAICQRTEYDRNWDIDHDHRHCPGTFGCAECVRGLLCSPCNIGISYLPTPEILMQAADYLDPPQNNAT